MKRNLRTIRQVADASPFTPAQLRNWIFRAADNGLHDHAVVYRIRNRVYLDVDALDRWIDAQQPAMLESRECGGEA